MIVVYYMNTYQIQFGLLSAILRAIDAWLVMVIPSYPDGRSSRDPAGRGDSPMLKLQRLPLRTTPHCSGFKMNADLVSASTRSTLMTTARMLKSSGGWRLQSGWTAAALLNT